MIGLVKINRLKKFHSKEKKNSNEKIWWYLECYSFCDIFKQILFFVWIHPIYNWISHWYSIFFFFWREKFFSFCSIVCYNCFYFFLHCIDFLKIKIEKKKINTNYSREMKFLMLFCQSKIKFYSKSIGYFVCFFHS